MPFNCRRLLSDQMSSSFTSPWAEPLCMCTFHAYCCAHGRLHSAAVFSSSLRCRGGHRPAHTRPPRTPPRRRCCPASPAAGSAPAGCTNTKLIFFNGPECPVISGRPPVRPDVHGRRQPSTGARRSCRDGRHTGSRELQARNCLTMMGTLRITAMGSKSAMAAADGQSDRHFRQECAPGTA